MSTPVEDGDSIELTGLWLFQPDPFGQGENSKYFTPHHKINSWLEATVPSTFERTLPSLTGYEGAAWYRKDVIVPESWRDRRVTLRFEGANYRTAVWVNGVEVGRNEDGFLPFEFEVQELLNFGESNVLAACVDNSRRLEDVPGKQTGWRPHGGILREVSLLATNHYRIESVRITAQPHASGGFVEALVCLSIDDASLADFQVTLAIHNSSAMLARFEVETAAQVQIAGTIADVLPWSPDSPKLYTATLELRRKNCVVDQRTLHIGFRKIEVQSTQLLLNGAPIFLTGFNRHEDSPRTDYCPDHELTRCDLESMKRMGCNFVRLCHYPHHPRELEICDELGLLVMAEIPLYWWQGCRQGEEIFAQKKQAARRQLERMIERDYNHPSIIAWAVSNETAEELPEVVAGNSELLKFCKTLDTTRLATHVSNRWMQHPHFEEDDLVCVNGYPSYDNATGEPGANTSDGVAKKWWGDQLCQLHSLYPDKPILISEFGYAAFDGVMAGSIGEDAQAQAIAWEYSAFHLPYICGTVVWCYADHPWPDGAFLNGINTSPYGVVTRDRRKKRAFAEVAALFTNMQSLRSKGAPQSNLL